MRGARGLGVRGWGSDGKDGGWSLIADKNLGADNMNRTILYLDTTHIERRGRPYLVKTRLLNLTQYPAPCCGFGHSEGH